MSKWGKNLYEAKRVSGTNLAYFIKTYYFCRKVFALVDRKLRQNQRTGHQGGGATHLSPPQRLCWGGARGGAWEREYGARGGRWEGEGEGASSSLFPFRTSPARFIFSLPGPRPNKASAEESAPLTERSSEPAAMYREQGLNATPTGCDLFTWPS